MSQTEEATKGYVSYAEIATEQELHTLLQYYTQSGDFFFFLRWRHEVSGIITDLPKHLSPEGQVFNACTELRWKLGRQGYELLWLGQKKPEAAGKFVAIDRTWEAEDHPALLFDRKTPQYPNRFRYPKGLEKQIRQRYFRDAHTSIVHFIALTVQPPNA